jgi:hypothetical protein
MTTKRVLGRSMSWIVILALTLLMAFEPAAATQRGGVRHGGGHGGGHGGPGGPGRGGPGGPGRGPGGPGRHGPAGPGIHHMHFHGPHFHGFHIGFHPRPMFWHPVGFFVAALATTAVIVSINDRNYHYDQGVYYQETSGGYKAVSAPIGAKIPDLPDDTQTVIVGGVSYYYYMGVFYNQGSDGYSVIQAPTGAMVSYLPEGYTTKSTHRTFPTEPRLGTRLCSNQDSRSFRFAAKDAW